MEYDQLLINKYLKNPEIVVPEYTRNEYLNYYKQIDNQTYFDIWNNSNSFFPYYLDIFDNIFKEPIDKIYDYLIKIKDSSLLVQLLYNDYKIEIQILELAISKYSNANFELFYHKIQEATDILPAILLQNIIKCELQKSIFEQKDFILPNEFMELLKKNQYSINLVYNYIKYTINDLIYYKTDSLQYSNASKVILVLKPVLEKNKETIFNQISRDINNNDDLTENFNHNILKNIMLATLYIENADTAIKNKYYDELLLYFNKSINKKRDFPISYCLGNLAVNEAHRTIAEIILNSTKSIDNYYNLLINSNDIIHTMRFHKADTENINTLSFILTTGLSLIDILIENNDIEKSLIVLTKLWNVTVTLKNIFGDSYFSLFLSSYQKHLITRKAFLPLSSSTENKFTSIIQLLTQIDSRTAIKSLEMIEYNKIKLDYTTLDNNDKKIILQMIENILSSTKQNESDSFIDFCKELKKKL